MIFIFMLVKRFDCFTKVIEGGSLHANAFAYCFYLSNLHIVFGKYSTYLQPLFLIMNDDGENFFHNVSLLEADAASVRGDD